jgi:hypothetical protein
MLAVELVCGQAAVPGIGVYFTRVFMSVLCRCLAHFFRPLSSNNSTTTAPQQVAEVHEVHMHVHARPFPLTRLGVINCSALVRTGVARCTPWSR